MPLPIQPDPADLLGVSGHRRSPNHRRAGRVLQACNTCRCDGTRPACRNCLGLGLDCGYKGAADKSRYGAIKSQLEALESLFDLLKVSPPDQAGDLIRRIRAADDVSELVQEGRGSETRRSETPPVPVGLSHLAAPSLEATRTAVDRFYASSGKLFHVFSPAQSADNLARAFDDENNDRLSAEPKKVSACCAFAVASVGTRYSPGQFDPALEEAFYQLARHHFETIIEHRPMDAIKVCTMLAMNNIMDKATVALSYVEVGLSMARRYGLYEKRCPNRQYSPKEWIDYRRTWRTLVFFSSWLSSTLGYVSGNDTLFQVPLSEMDVDNSREIEDVVQTELAKISLLKVSILRVSMNFTDLSPLATESIFRDLQHWHDGLPAEMSLPSLAREELPAAVRWSIYYVHLLYLGAIMLLYRRVASFLCQSLAPGPVPAARSVLSFGFADYLDGPAERGVLAAKQSAAILGLIVGSRGLFKRCWLVMFQAYTSAIALLHAAAQKQLHRFPPAAWADDLAHAAQCLRVLEYCGSIDRVASGFHVRLAPIYDKIAAYAPADMDVQVVDPVQVPVQTPVQTPVPAPPSLPPLPQRANSSFSSVSSSSFSSPHSPFSPSSSSSATSATSTASSSAYLLDIPAGSDPDHAAVSVSLLGMLCTPFGDPEARSLADQVARAPGWCPEPTCFEHPQMVEQLGLRLEDQMRMRRRDDVAAATAVTEQVVGLPSLADIGVGGGGGCGFLGGLEPHGWSAGAF